MINSYTFLIIEDNSIDQIVTTQLLKKVLNVQEVNLAKNGSEGLQWLKNHSNEANKNLIILVDIKMAEMDGIEFLLEFEKLSDAIKSNSIIFMLSSTLDPQEIQEAENNIYVKKVLSKPLPAKQLEALILAAF
jgi:CheY-like chemotaxis protein